MTKKQRMKIINKSKEYLRNIKWGYRKAVKEDRMRDAARFLIEIKKTEVKIEQLLFFLDLKPKYNDNEISDLVEKELWK